MSSSKTESVRRFSVKRVDKSVAERIVDTVAAEEPLEIRIQYWIKDLQSTESLAVVMRTPGHDRELAAGFLLSEGVIDEHRDIRELRGLGSEPQNEILVELTPQVDFDAWKSARASFVGASCGICGKRTREAVAQEIRPPDPTAFVVNASLIRELPALLRTQQPGFAQTGGLHAAALVDSSGAVKVSFEDIGRHNALDKLIGWCVLGHRVPMSDGVIFMSSRSSFELIQKAARAGAPVLATVGGPSSLAIEAAREYGITLLGFVRGQRFNIYSGDWRVNSE